VEVVLRHRARRSDDDPRTAGPGKIDYDIWISDGDLVRTYAAVHKLGHPAASRNRPRGLNDRDFPGSSSCTSRHRAAPWRPWPDNVHPPAGLCQTCFARAGAR